MTTAAVRPQDWRLLLASLRQFGPSPDGAVERDLEAAIAREVERRKAAEAATETAYRLGIEAARDRLGSITILREHAGVTPLEQARLAHEAAIAVLDEMLEEDAGDACEVERQRELAEKAAGDANIRAERSWAERMIYLRRAEKAEAEVERLNALKPIAHNAVTEEQKAAILDAVARAMVRAEHRECCTGLALDDICALPLRDGELSAAETVAAAHIAALESAGYAVVPVEPIGAIRCADPDRCARGCMYSRCKAGNDGDCYWEDCPQMIEYQGHCPLDLCPFCHRDAGGA